MTVFDFVVIGVVLLSLVIGAWRGVVSEILALVAWVMAFLAARTWAAPAGGWLATGLADPLAEPLLQQVVGFVAIFVAVLILFALARWMVSLLLRAVGLAPLDRVLGSLFGIARGDRKSVV